MFNKKLLKKTGSYLFLFLLCFGLISGAYADDLGTDKNMIKEKNLKNDSSVRYLNTVSDDNDDSDDVDDDSDDIDDENDDSDDDSIVEEEISNYYVWEWKEVKYYIDTNEFNLTDEELTELFTKRDDLREEIANLKLKIENIELTRNENILLAIDELYEAINKVTSNSQFNDKLLSIKDINITDVNSTFNELKSILESIKEEYPDEDFTEIDLSMDNLESLLNEELETYENLTSELKNNFAELGELFEEYPFLVQQVVFINDHIYDNTSGNISRVLGSDVPDDDYEEDYEDEEVDLQEEIDGSEDIEVDSIEKKVVSKNHQKIFAEMKNTGIPNFFVTLLILLSLFSLLRSNVKKKL